MQRTLLCCLIVFGMFPLSRAHAQEKEQQPLDIGPVGRAVLVRDTGGHTAVPRHVVFTPDSMKLVSTGDDRTVQVWDVLTRERLRVFRLPLGADGQGGLAPWPMVQGLALVMDRKGEQVALCVSAKGDLAKDRVRWSYSHGHFQKMDGDNWVEEGQGAKFQFVEVRRTGGSVELFDKKRNYTVTLYDNQCKLKRGDAEPVHLYDGTWGVLSTFVCTLATGEAKVLNRVGPRDFSLDGKSLVIGEGKFVRWVDIATGTLRFTTTLPTSNVVDEVVFSPDGSTLAVATQDSKIYLLDGTSLKLKKTLTVAGASNIRNISWADQSTLVCRTWNTKAMLVVDAATGAVKFAFGPDVLYSYLPKEAKGEKNSVLEVRAITGTTKAFVRSHHEGNIRVAASFLFDWSTGKAEEAFKQKSAFDCTATAIAPDMTIAAQGDGDRNDIVLWDPQTGKPFRANKDVARLRAPVRGANGSYNALRWRLDGRGFFWEQISEIPSVWGGFHQMDLTTLTKKGVQPAAFDRVGKDNAARVLDTPRDFAAYAKNFHANERGISRQWEKLWLTGNGDIIMGKDEPFPVKGMWSICGWDITFVEGGRIAYHPWDSNLTEVYDSATGKRLQSVRPVRSRILSWAVSPEPANRYLLLGSADQTLTVYNTATGKVLLTFFPTRQEWIVWTPEGYYAATPGGERLMGWHVDNGPERLASFYPAERFRNQLYRPDVIKLVLEKGSVEEALKAANAALPPESRPKSNVVVDVAKLLPPGTTLKLLSANDKGVVKLSTDVVAEPGGEGVKSVRLMVDGRPASGKEFYKEFDKPQAKITYAWPDLQLPPGKHQVVVLARSADSSSASNVLEIDTRPAKDKPTLHVLAFGVSKYKDKGLDLAAAANDAELIAKSFIGCKGAMFGEVRVTVLPDEKATRSGILGAIASLRTGPTKVKDGDLAVVFFAGHGVRQKEEFFLLPHDTDLDNLAKTALSGAKLQDELKALPCQVLFMMDACHSAGYGSKGKLGQKNLAPATDVATRQMTDDEVAVVVMCAAMGNEKAIERQGNGLFAKAVAAALTAKDGVPCNPVNHKQYLHHLQSYVFDTVMAESDDRQHPFLHLPWVVESFPLRKVK